MKWRSLLALLGLLTLVGCLRPPLPVQIEMIYLEDVLEPLHPDEPPAHTLGVRFSPDNALRSIDRLRDMSPASGLTGEEYMAFANRLTAVEGTVRKQAFDLARLELELALYKYRAKEISLEELHDRERAYRQALEAFKTFWRTAKILD